MDFLLSIFICLIVAVISYWWLKRQRTRNKMKWLPEVPGVPILGNILEFSDLTNILKVVSRFCDKYDGLYTIEVVGKKGILASNPEFLEFLLSKLDILDKSEEYQYLQNWLGEGLLIADGHIWKKSRKMLTPSFHFSILENFIDTFNINANILVELLEKQVGESFDVAPHIAMCTLDIICETTMGVSINAQRNPKSEYVHAVNEKCRLLMVRTCSPIKRSDILYPLTRDYYLDKKLVNILHSHTLKVINERKQELKNKKEKLNTEDDVGVKKKKVFLDLLLEATIDGHKLTDEQIRQQVDTFMFAGHDTTGSSVSFTLFCLSTNPDAQNYAVEEQKNIFGDDRHRPATHRDLQEMKYLEMVIKESLRMYPPVPHIARRTKRDVEYQNGHIIPEGTGILVLIYCANRNPKYFAEPDKFNPSRFEESKNYSQYVYLPFSAGPRNCIGQKYAMLEMKTILSTILRNYELQPSGQDLILVSETVLKSANGINIKLKRRETWN